MAQLLSLLAVATAAAASPGLGRVSQDGDGLGRTTAGLEQSTWQFAAAHGLAAFDAGAVAGRRLRSASTQQTRHGKASKGGYGYYDDDDDDDDDTTTTHRHHHHNGRTDDDASGYSGKGGKGGGKSGKMSKGGRDDGDDEMDGELFYLLPSACPNECVTSQVTADTHEFLDALQPCQADADSHLWRVHSDGSYVMLESHDLPHMCVGVDYEPGDSQALLAQTCYNGELVLRDCDDEFGTEWYFTGGQLVSALCWGAGLASLMTVFLEDEDDNSVQACRKDVAVWGANDEAVLKADTFLFVNRLPHAPFVLEDPNAKLAETLASADGDGTRMAGVGASVGAAAPAGASETLDFDGAA